MGLRQRAEAVNLKDQQPLNEPNNEPLSLFFDAKHKFKNLLKELNVEKGGFLIKTNEDFYNLCFAYSIDITTFHRCIIPAEIINSFEIKKNEWYSLSDKNLSSIKNFFSSQEYISITSLFLFPIEQNKSFLFLIKSQKDVYRENFDFEKADKKVKEFLPIYEKYKSIIETAKPVYSFQYGENSIILKIKSALSLNNTAHLLSISFLHAFPDSVKLQIDLDEINLYYSITNKILNLIGKSNTALLSTNHCLYASIFSAQRLPMEVYIKKITSSLNKIYGEELCNKLLVEYTGTSKNIDEIKNFLKAGINDKAG